jgi:hypothetical protein
MLQRVALLAPMSCLGEAALAGDAHCCKSGDSAVLAAGTPYLVGQILLALAAQLMRLDAGCRGATAASVTRPGVLVLHLHPEHLSGRLVHVECT